MPVLINHDDRPAAPLSHAAVTVPSAPSETDSRNKTKPKLPKWNSLILVDRPISAGTGSTGTSFKRKLSAMLGTGEQACISRPVPKSVNFHKLAQPFRATMHDNNSKAKLPFSSMMVLELCAGTAGLTAALRRAGFDALGIDRSRNRHASQAPTAVLDLSTEGGQRIVREVLNSGRLLYCKPCSRPPSQSAPSSQRSTIANTTLQ